MISSWTRKPDLVWRAKSDCAHHLGSFQFTLSYTLFPEQGPSGLVDDLFFQICQMFQDKLKKGTEALLQLATPKYINLS